ncbi:MAG TPA: chromosomal replication initiator protein DnaA [Ktedonobacterales bacterium]|nr:chromosomal replication initiator protein DnaA [Ktedonobacterales bacterium]
MEATQVWQAALERVRRRVSPSAFATWFGETVGVELRQHCITVAVPSTFAEDHLRQRFGELARIAVSEVIGERAEIIFVVRPAQGKALAQRTHIRAAGRRDAAETQIAPPPRTGSALPARSPSGAASRATRRQPAALAQQVATAYEPRSAPSSRGRKRSATRLVADVSVAQPPLLTFNARPVRLSEERIPTQPAAKEVAAAGSVVDAIHENVPYDAPASIYELNPRYVFETFTVGTSNRLAYAAAQEVASTPGERYNPLFVYGDVGLGKTHLLHAIGHLARSAGLHVAYVTAERFTNEIIEAIRQRTTDFFRARYRAVDVLLVDDVQFIAGKESTEEEFFHTFNALHDVGRQIVLSSDRVPQAMAHLHNRLRSRFAWGLMADIQPPDFEHRLEILRAKADGLRMPVSEEVLACVARPECESIRALEGSLNRVIAYARMLKQPLDVRLVASALAPLAGEVAARRTVDASAVLAAVTQHFSVRMEELLGKSREHGVAWARQVAMYLLREETPASLLQIGQQLGGRDHTTIMHGCARVGKALTADERAREDMAALRAVLRV